MPVYRDKGKNTYYVKFRYKDWRGDTHDTTKRGFSKKKDAKKYEDDFKRKYAGASDMKMKSLCELYLADARLRLRPKTYRNTAARVNRHIVSRMGDIAINIISPAVIKGWQNDMSEYVSPRTKRKLSPYTLSCINTQLSGIMNYGVRFYGLKSNPVSIAGGMGKREPRREFWEKPVYDKFISVVDDALDHVIFNTLFYSGLRVSELLALTHDDIDFIRNTLTVNKAIDIDLTYSDDYDPKNEPSHRTITMPKKVLDEVQAYWEKLLYEPMRLFDISYRTLNNHFRSWIDAAEVKKITIHGLRHSHASFLITNKMPITAISHRLGHANPKITLAVYSHMYKNDDKEIANLLENS